MADTAADLAVVDRYVDEITTFIQGLIFDERQAIMITCKVFLQYKERNDYEAFEDEEARKGWLYLKARNLANDHLKRRQNV